MMASSSQRSCSMTTGWPTHSVKVRLLRPASGWSGRISAPTAVGNSAITSTPRCRLSTNSTPKSLSPERSASPISLGCTASTVKLTLGCLADISSTTCGRKRTSSDSSEMMRTSPLTVPPRLAISARVRWYSFWVSRTWRSSSSPAAVGRTPLRPRSNKATPISSSKPQDLAVDRRGGDAQRIGSLADRAMARDMIEVAQDRGMHGDLPFRRPMPNWQRTARINVLF